MIIIITSEQCRVSRPQFLRSMHGTPGTMTPLLASKMVAFSDMGLLTEARVMTCALSQLHGYR